MEIVVSLIAIAILFYILGKSADLVVINTRNIGERFGIKIFFLGLMLGFLTSLPEFSIGINALAKNIVNISFGNLIGGIFVLLGFVLGLGLVLNRKIATDGRLSTILPGVFLLLLPILLGADGAISTLDGVVLILGYLFVIYHAYKQEKQRAQQKHQITTTKKELIKTFFFLIIGLASVIVVSNLIINISLSLLERWNISKLLVGVLFFSVGTNLPEIIVTIRSWRQHTKELSLSNIYGSALANTFIIGLLSSINPITITINGSYLVVAVFMLFLLGAFAYFYESGRELTKREGIILFSLYFVFIIIESFFFLK